MDAELDEQAAERLHQAIAREGLILGPVADDDEETPLPHVALDDWVLVMSWTDLDTGECHLSRTWSPKLPYYRRTGLLHEGLHW